MNRVTRLVCLASPLLALCSSPACAVEEKGVTPAAAGFRELADDMVKTGQTDGVSIVVVKDGKTSYYAAGLASRTAHSPVSTETVFEIGSISKVFSSLILAHAVHERRMSLGDDIRQYLPQSYPNLEAEGHAVQVGYLADWTSALPDNLPETETLVAGVPADQRDSVIAAHLAHYTFAGLLDDLRGATLKGPPGVTPRHSNVAAELLGAALSRRYDTSYEALLKRYIEAPYAMHSGIHIDERVLAAGYASDDTPAAPHLRGEAVMAAGGLKYSARDMGRFLKALIAGADPAIGLTRLVRYGDPDTTAYALNWQVSRTPDGLQRYRTSGGTFGFSSYIEYYPALHYGTVLLANRSGEVQDHLKWMAERAKDRLFGKPASLLEFEKGLEQTGFSDVASVAHSVRQRHPEFNLSEDLLNTWAFGLLFEGKKTQGLALLEYFATEHPGVADAQLAYAEGCANAEQNERAIAAFQNALRLDPGNEYAKHRIADLESAAPK